MRYRPSHVAALLACAAALSSCTQHTRLLDIADLPLKDTDSISTSWQVSPIRANAQYVLYGAESNRERRNRLGDYYFVNWYDADPSRPVRLEMLYTQAATASQVLSRVVEFNEPRSSSGHRKTKFVFNGPERAQRGDVLSWRINLYADGKLVDSRHSYLWQD